MKLLPADAQTYSKAPSRYATGAPQLVSRASGAWVGTEGNMVVDLTSGMGAVILGHQHYSVDKAVRDQLLQGIAFPLPTQLETDVAQQLVGMLTWKKAESVRFGKNGADVTGAAVKLARAVTNRKLVMYCDYHGHHPWSMCEPPWNAGVTDGDNKYSRRYTRDLDMIEGALQKEYFAAIVLEGSSSVNAGPDPDGFFEGLRKACDNSGTLLVLDEMVTGFRMAPGGAAEALGIEPDLACYGKAMANGLPLSAIVGPWEHMRRFEEDVFFSTTHGGEALSLAAAKETLRLIEKLNVPKVVGELGLEIIDRVRYRVHIKYGYPQRLVFDINKNQLQTMMNHGVLCAGYANLTLSHAYDDLARYQIFKALEAL